MHDGPALGVEPGDAGAFFAEGRIGPGFEELAFAEPGGLVEEADVRFDGAANGPTFVVELGGGVELGETLFEPEGAAGAGVQDLGVLVVAIEAWTSSWERARSLSGRPQWTTIQSSLALD